MEKLIQYVYQKNDGGCGRKMNQENIDIIIPIYNAEKTIAETLQSIIMQSYTSWRVIIIDDGSIDKSVDIVKKYMKKESRIEYFYKENGGIISARIAGIKRIKNKFVMLVDNDDILHSQCLEIFKLIMEKTDAEHGYVRIISKYVKAWSF